MPPSAGSGRVDTLVMHPDKHISVPNPELLAALRNRLPEGDQQQYDDLVKLMEGVASFDFMDLKERMRTNFLPFASGARNQVYLQRNAKGMPTTSKLDQKELEFVGDTFDVLRASHYHLLTKDEWKLALSESFNLTLPMEVDWAYMDPALLKKFWTTSPARQAVRQHLPDEVADHILVFHRGVGSAKLKGLFIQEKIDLLCEYTVLRVLNALRAKLPAWAGGAKPAPKAAAATSEEEAEAAEQVKSLAMSPELMRQYTVARAKVTAGQYVASDHQYAKVVERVSLKRLCPSVAALVKAFLQPLELQEPTFKDVVVVYRRRMPERKAPAAGADAPTKNKFERMQGILNYRNICVKVFGETPMADIEIIFPSKRVGIKPFQLVNLMVTVVTALVMGGLTIWKAGKDINMNIVWTAASLVLTRCFQVYSDAQTQKAEMQRQMSAQLYDRMQDSQEGVVSVILEEMADQQFKQMLLAYTLLLLSKAPMHVDDLDAQCEEFLVNEFDAHIDFQVEDALPRLQCWGLVTRNSRDEVAAQPMPDAIDTLTTAWTIAYKALGNSSRAIATADLLSGRASTFGAGLEAWRAEKEGAEAAALDAANKKGIFGTSYNKAKGFLSFGKSSKGGADDGAAAAGADDGAGGAEGASPREEGGAEKKKKFSLKKLLA